jgi:hypothetical protein
MHILMQVELYTDLFCCCFVGRKSAGYKILKTEGLLLFVGLKQIDEN